MVKKSYVIILSIFACLLLGLTACAKQSNVVVAPAATPIHVESDEPASTQEPPSPPRSPAKTTMSPAIPTMSPEKPTAPPTDKPVSTQTQPTPSPAATKPQQKAVYIIEDGSIFAQTKSDKTLIYNPASHYDAGALSKVRRLCVEDDVLFFIEYGGFPEQIEDAKHSIIRLAKDGSNRQVLVSRTGPNGYMGFILYHSQLIYAEDGCDSGYIFDVSKDGSGDSRLDIEGFAAQNGFEPYFGGIDFKKNGDVLYADVSILSLTETEFMEGHARIRIHSDFHLELISIEETRRESF